MVTGDLSIGRDPEYLGQNFWVVSKKICRSQGDENASFVKPHIGGGLIGLGGGLRRLSCFFSFCKGLSELRFEESSIALGGKWCLTPLQTFLSPLSLMPRTSVLHITVWPWMPHGAISHFPVGSVQQQKNNEWRHSNMETSDLYRDISLWTLAWFEKCSSERSQKCAGGSISSSQLTVHS